MSTLYLHVGMPKTGTSFIQGFVSLNKALLQNLIGIEFISHRRPHEIATHLITNQNLFNRSDIFELRASDFNKIKRELESIKIKGNDCFCSSEYFTLCSKKVVTEFFLQYFDKIKIIYTVRRQDKLLASGFNQEVKALNCISNLGWNYTNAQSMRYFQNCKEWELLGCDVSVIDYDAVKKNKNGLNKAIFSLFIDPETITFDEFIEPAIDASNFSLSYDEVLLKLSMNRLNLKNDELYKELVEFKLAREEFALPTLYEGIIAACYYEDNKKLVNDYITSDRESNLTFPGVTINKNILIDSAQFVWDPLEQDGVLIEFLLKKLTHSL